MEPMKYVNLAASKDPTRFNLQSAYRDLDRIVATDGHRMHWLMQASETRGFVDPTMDKEAQFPDWKQVLPKNPMVSIPVQVSTTELKRLEALIKLGTVGQGKKRAVCAELTFTRDRLIVRVSNETDNYSGTVGLKIDSEEIKGNLPTFPIGVNLAYFADALRCVEQFKFPIQVTIDLFEKQYEGAPNGLAPIIITLGVLGAIIMPMQLAVNEEQAKAA